MATDYNQLKNAAILTPTGNTDLGSDTNRYSNVYMSGNIVMADGVTVTSNNVITPKIALVTYRPLHLCAGVQSIASHLKQRRGAGGLSIRVFFSTECGEVPFRSLL